jgi:ArsR family transcriptional regulator, arsenate/arsenite/antimonite-responsive transcriptional repressor
MDKHLHALDMLFKALGDPTRLRILGLLLTGEVCVCHIHDSLAIPQAKASRHLAYLRRAGLVASRRDGLWVHYRLIRHSDAIVATVQNAVEHALTHSQAVRRDLIKLQKQNSCGLPVSADRAGDACCPPVAMPVALMGRR